MSDKRNVVLLLFCLSVLSVAVVSYGFYSFEQQLGKIQEAQKNALTAYWQFNPRAEYHCIIEHYRNGQLLSMTNHPMTLVDQGKNQSKLLFSQQNSSGFIYFCNSNDSSAVDTAWTILPNEITDGGLARDLAAYTDAGTGTWNMTLTWNVTATRSTKLYGVTYNSGTTESLVLAEQQGISNQKNMNAGDTLRMTVQGTQS